MAVISQSNYQYIAQKYDDGRQLLLTASAYFYQAVLRIVSVADVQVELDCLAPFYNNYLASDTKYLASVRTINNHVLQRGIAQSGTNIATELAGMGDPGVTTGSPYNNVSEYLADTGGTGSPALTTVPAGWASLCSQTGQTIYSVLVKGG